VLDPRGYLTAFVLNGKHGAKPLHGQRIHSLEITLKLDDFACLDFEASSLSSRSWPIEVALAWIEAGKVQTWSSLIRPELDWPADAWSPASAAVHGIPLADLKSAPDAASVAHDLLQVLGGRRLVSDAPEFERMWLARLMDVIGIRPLPSVANFDMVSHLLFDGIALDIVYENLATDEAPHRAGPDSARLARALLVAAQTKDA
jgi:DNA polymerase III epsilon subunit-like protein